MGEACIIVGIAHYSVKIYFICFHASLNHILALFSQSESPGFRSKNRLKDKEQKKAVAKSHGLGVVMRKKLEVNFN